MLHTLWKSAQFNEPSTIRNFKCDARHWTTHLQTNSSTSHGLALLLKVLHELENQKVYTEVLPSNIGFTWCHSTLALQLDRDKVKRKD
jgi:hypothetical protein